MPSWTGMIYKILFGMIGLLTMSAITGDCQENCPGRLKRCHQARNLCYDPIKKKCCGTSLIDVQYSCCTGGSMPAESYLPSTHICCGGNLSAIAQGKVPADYTCCGGDLKLFNARSMCCNGQWHGALDPEQIHHLKCCGKDYYDSDVDMCCMKPAGAIYLYHIWPRGPTSRCCGQQAFDMTKHWCTPLKRLILINQSPCGSMTISTTTQMCCAGVVHDITSGEDRCCGSHIQHMHQVCCEGTVHNKTANKSCCKSDYYNPSTEECCGSEVISRTNGSVVCCQHTVLTLPDSAQPGQYNCCSNALMDTTREKCVRGIPTPIPKLACRGDVVSNCICHGSELTEKQLCCNGRVKQKDRGNDDNQCCLLNENIIETFNNRSLICTVDGIQPIPPKCPQFDKSKQTCCNGRVYTKGDSSNPCNRISKRKNRCTGDLVSNCLCRGKELTEKQLCCHGQVTQKVSEEDNQCCLIDENTMKSFNNRTQICTDDGIQPIPPKCPQFDKSKQTCCNGRVYTKGDRSNPCNRSSKRKHRCTGDLVSNCLCRGKELTEKQLCCQGQVAQKVSEEDNQCCLIDKNTMKTINNRTQICTPSLPIPHKCPQFDESKQTCCNGKVFSILTHTTECCQADGRVYMKGDMNNPCNPKVCEGKNYDPFDYLCCGDRLFHRVFGAHCCGAAPYSKKDGESCCGVHILEKDSREKCCNAMVPYEPSISKCSRKKVRQIKGNYGPVTRRQKCRACSLNLLQEVDSWNIQFCKHTTIIRGTIAKIIQNKNEKWVKVKNIRSLRYRRRHIRVFAQVIWLKLPKKCLCLAESTQGQKVFFMTSKKLKRSSKNMLYFKCSRHDHIGLYSESQIQKMKQLRPNECKLLL